MATTTEGSFPRFGGSRGYDDDGGYRWPGFGRDSDRDGGDYGRDRFLRDQPRGFGDRDRGFDRGFERRGGLGGYDRPRDRDYDRDRGFGGGGRRECGSSFRETTEMTGSAGMIGIAGMTGTTGIRTLRRGSTIIWRSSLALCQWKRTRRPLPCPRPPEPAPKASSAIFGIARPVDTAARERDIEAQLARQREEEERRQIWDREPFQDSLKDDRVWLSIVPARGRGDRGYSNDSDQHSQNSLHGSQAGYDGPVRVLSRNSREPGDLAKRPPADRIRRPDYGGSGPRDGRSTRNSGERPFFKQELTYGHKSDDGKEVVCTSRNIYAHLQQEDGDEVSD
ncbi:hypothetical protein MRX96_034409 [Rhipicephalus microplus]